MLSGADEETPGKRRVRRRSRKTAAASASPGKSDAVRRELEARRLKLDNTLAPGSSINRKAFEQAKDEFMEAFERGQAVLADSLVGQAFVESLLAYVASLDERFVQLAKRRDAMQVIQEARVLMRQMNVALERKDKGDMERAWQSLVETAGGVQSDHYASVPEVRDFLVEFERAGMRRFEFLRRRVDVHRRRLEQTLLTPLAHVNAPKARERLAKAVAAEESKLAETSAGISFVLSIRQLLESSATRIAELQYRHRIHGMAMRCRDPLRRLQDAVHRKSAPLTTRWYKALHLNMRPLVEPVPRRMDVVQRLLEELIALEAVIHKRYPDFLLLGPRVKPFYMMTSEFEIEHPDAEEELIERRVAARIGRRKKEGMTGSQASLVSLRDRDINGSLASLPSIPSPRTTAENAAKARAAAADAAKAASEDKTAAAAAVVDVDGDGDLGEIAEDDLVSLPSSDEEGDMLTVTLGEDDVDVERLEGDDEDYSDEEFDFMAVATDMDGVAGGSPGDSLGVGDDIFGGGLVPGPRTPSPLSSLYGSAYSAYSYGSGSEEEPADENEYAGDDFEPLDSDAADSSAAGSSSAASPRYSDEEFDAAAGSDAGSSSSSSSSSAKAK